MKKFASFLISIISISMLSQNSQNKFEKYPVFTECAEESISELEIDYKLIIRPKTIIMPVPRKKARK